MIDPRDFDGLHALMTQAAEEENFDFAAAVETLRQLAPDPEDRDPLINALLKQRERREKKLRLTERYGPLAGALSDFIVEPEQT